MQIALDILRSIWLTATQMAPWLLMGFLVAGVLSIFLSPKTVESHLGTKGWWSVVKASVFGVPLPLCSCGVIPVAALLRRHGASRGATISFLLSTPQTGMDSILVTYSLLGPLFAVFRPLAAFISGVAGGAITDALTTDRPAEQQNGDASPDDQAPSLTQRLRHAVRFALVTLPADLARPMAVGLVVAGIIAALLPEDFFAAYLGNNAVAMVVMMIAGIPVYVCATASVPIAAAMMAKGLSAGAAFVFLMTGPATNAATVATIWKLMGRRTAIIYLACVGGFALLLGALLNMIAGASGIEIDAMHHHDGAGPAGTLSAIVMLALLLQAVLQQTIRRRREAARRESGCACGAPDVKCRSEG